MCGIVGIFNLDGKPVSPVILKRMTDAIAHRGPDSEGFYIDSFVGLGHRRLAIIDLSPLGHQPMMTSCGQYIITYNGELYNFRELKIELQSLGYEFRSKSDTEVLLNAYKHWKEKCLDKFNGHFAFAIWDKNNQSLFLAVDRFGTKPIYYCFVDNTFIFASEQKAILQFPELKRELDLEAVYEYFTFQNIFTDKTFFKGVKLFPAGHYAYVQLANRDIKLYRYWRWHFSEPKNPKPKEEYVEELDFLFKQAVNRQLISDVEIGAYLSGGMDTGSIVAIASKQLNYIKTFTCGFDLHSASGLELAFDEREKAELMSYLFKTEHYEMVIKAGDMERALPKVVWHTEEPRVGQSYPNYYAAQIASKFVKVVLSGTGGDELFGGYPWRYYRPPEPINDFERYIDNYYLYWQRLIPNSVLQKLFQPVWEEVKHVWTRDIFKSIFLEDEKKLERPEDYINNSLTFEARTFLRGLLLVEDKLSMAHGLESRMPFLDNDLVEFAMICPVKFKLNNLLSLNIFRIDENEPFKLKKYYERTKDGKRILREVMRRYIPEEIVEGEKQGFSAPDASWFKGDSIEYVKRELLNKSARIYQYMNFSVAKDLINEHLEGKQNRRLLLWSLLCFEWFLREYL